MARLRAVRGTVVPADLAVPDRHQRVPDRRRASASATAANRARAAHRSTPTRRRDPAPAEVAWLEPVPDRLVIDERGDPAEVVAARHRVRLALVAGMQVLAPRQRAAFIVCDVLAVPAAEAAEMLGVSVAAVKSLLQRARGRLAEVSLTDDELAEPTDEGPARSWTATSPPSRAPTWPRWSACWPTRRCWR